MLSVRVTKLLSKQKGIVIKKMFGGVCFMLKDKMIIGTAKGRLMVRCMPERYEELLDKPHARVMDFTGKVIKGYLFIADAGVKTDKQLRWWIDIGIEYAMKSLPKKKPAAKTTSRKIK